MDDVASLADRSAIVDVLTRYGVAIDSGDWAALRSCFAPDAVLRFPGRPLEGPDAIVAFIREATARWKWQQHMLGSFQVGLDRDTATTSCYLQAMQVARDAPDEVLITAGVYRDRLERRGGTWMIVERSLDVGWTATRRR